MAASRSISLCGEASLPVAAVAFGDAYGGGAVPAHHFAELCLTPAFALAQGADVRADDGRLLVRDVVYAAASSRRHAPVSFASTARMTFPPSSGCQPQ